MGKLQGEGEQCSDLQKYQPQPQRQWAAFVGICLHPAFQREPGLEVHPGAPARVLL